MALTYSNSGKIGLKAPDFLLPGVDGKNYSLNDFKDAKALVVIFMCSHCPYVIATLNRIIRLAHDFSSQGVQVVGISSNDATRYPDDSFEAMKKVSQEKKFGFPYLFDESQEVARSYGAVCTPEFYAYRNSTTSDGKAQFVLEYLGRLDDQWKDESAVQQRDLADALRQILAGKEPNPDQKPAMGCSIKWKM